VVDQQFAADHFVARIGVGIYDKAAKTVYLGISAQNVDEQEAGFDSTFTLSSGGVLATGRLLQTRTKVPFGQTGSFTLASPKVADFDPATATLLLGDPKKPSRTIPLHRDDSFASAADLPATWPLDLWANQGKYSFHFTQARLMIERFHTTAPTEKDFDGDRVLELVADAWTSGKDTFAGFTLDDHVELKRPDGRTALRKGSSGGVVPYSYSAFGPVTARFTVAPAVAGTYTLVVNGRSSGFTDNVHVNLATVEVPMTLAAPNWERPVQGPLPEPGRPVPAVPASKPGTTSTTSPAAAGETRDIDVAFAEGGVSFRFDRLVTDPAKSTATLSGRAETIAVQPPPEKGLLATDHPGVETRGTVYLAWDGNWAAGRLTSKPLVPWGGATVTLTFDLPFVPPKPGELDLRFSLDRSSVVFAPTAPKEGGFATVVVAPINPTAGLPPVTGATGVTPFPAGGAPITIGLWTVHLVSGRIGPVRVTYSVPADWVTVELTVEATLDASAKEADFLAAGNFFLTRPDGYLVLSMDTVRLDQSGTLAKGEKGTYVVNFDVPAAQLQPRMAMLVRSKDERSSVLDKDKSWTEVTLPFSPPPALLPPQPPPVAPPDPGALGG